MSSYIFIIFALVIAFISSYEAYYNSDKIILKLNENASNIADEILERKTEKVEEYAINGEKNWKKKNLNLRKNKLFLKLFLFQADLLSFMFY